MSSFQNRRETPDGFIGSENAERLRRIPEHGGEKKWEEGKREKQFFLCAFSVLCMTVAL